MRMHVQDATSMTTKWNGKTFFVHIPSSLKRKNVEGFRISNIIVNATTKPCERKKHE